MTTTTDAGLRIVRVLEVVDTREYEERDDRWVPIPGSGLAHDCARCGRSHEVHATVELSDGTVAVVGTGCAGALDFDQAARLRSGAAAAKAVARLRAELAGAVAARAAWEAAWVDVKALPLPPVVEGARRFENGNTVATLAMGGVEVWLPQGRTPERLETLATQWRGTQHRARVGGALQAPRVDDIERRLARAEKKLRLMVESA